MYVLTFPNIVEIQNNIPGTVYQVPWYMRLHFDSFNNYFYVYSLGYLRSFIALHLRVFSSSGCWAGKKPQLSYYRFIPLLWHASFDLPVTRAFAGVVFCSFAPAIAR